MIRLLLAAAMICASAFAAPKKIVAVAADGSTPILLGRPLRAYATVYVVNTDFKAKLNPAGWSE